MIWSEATPIEAEMVCEPAYRPTAYPRSSPAIFAHTIGTSRHSASTITENTICFGPSLPRPRKNCGPTP